MNKLKKIILRISAVAVILSLTLVPASVFAAAGDVPSLFHNDEEWYKDSLYPLTSRGGKYYVPSALFSMFSYISVSTPTADNILIHNTQNGKYVSLLFTNSSAAVNGTIVKNVGIFRDDDMYYVDAELVCDGIGIGYELYTTENGKEHFRLYDEDHSLAFDNLVLGYLDSENDDGGDVGGDKTETTKRIFLICKPAGQYNNEYSAQLILDYYGLDYTMFLNSSAATWQILSASAHGEYGVIYQSTARKDGVDIAAELDGINKMAYRYTGRKSRLTLSTGKDEEDAILENMGYIPLVPDFTVNGSSNAEKVFAEILQRASKYGYCIVYLDDCWNSTKIAQLLSDMTDPNFKASNLINSGK